MVSQIVRCTKCGHEAPYEEWPKGRDFFQQAYISRCLNPECDNLQNPGDASMRMMLRSTPPFVFVRNDTPDDPLAATLHRANEAS